MPRSHVKRKRRGPEDERGKKSRNRIRIPRWMKKRRKTLLEERILNRKASPQEPRTVMGVKSEGGDPHRW